MNFQDIRDTAVSEHDILNIEKIKYFGNPTDFYFLVTLNSAVNVEATRSALWAAFGHRVRIDYKMPPMSKKFRVTGVNFYTFLPAGWKIGTEKRWSPKFGWVILSDSGTVYMLRKNSGVLLATSYALEHGLDVGDVIKRFAYAEAQF